MAAVNTSNVTNFCKRLTSTCSKAGNITALSACHSKSKKYHFRRKTLLSPECYISFGFKLTPGGRIDDFLPCNFKSDSLTTTST